MIAAGLSILFIIATGSDISGLSFPTLPWGRYSRREDPEIVGHLMWLM